MSLFFRIASVFVFLLGCHPLFAVIVDESRPVDTLVKRLDTTSIPIPATLLPRPENLWPESTWRQTFNSEDWRTSDFVSTRVILPSEGPAGARLYIYAPLPLVSIVLEGVSLDLKPSIEPNLDGFYLTLPANWQGKTLWLRSEYWGNNTVGVFWGPSARLAPFIEKMNRYWGNYLVQGPIEFKEGDRHSHSPWQRAKSLDERAERAKTLTFRLTLPDWDLPNAMTTIVLDQLRSIRIYVDGEPWFQWPRPSASSPEEITVDGTTFLRLPEGWQGKTIEAELSYQNMPMVPGIALFDAAQNLSQNLKGAQFTPAQNFLGWGGLVLGGILLLLFVLRRKDAILLAVGFGCLLTAYDYGPGTFYFWLYSLTGYGPWFLNLVDSSLYSLVFLAIYTTGVPDSRTKLLRWSWWLLGAWTSLHSLLAIAVMAIPTLSLPWDLGLPQYYSVAVVLLWCLGLLVSHRSKTRETWLMLGLIAVLALRVSASMIFDAVPWEITLGTRTAITNISWFLMLGLLGAIPLSLFFRNEAELTKKNQTLTETNLVFKRFVPQEFLDVLGIAEVHDIQLGRQKETELSILFSDIRSFTKLAERMDPAATFAFINEYLQKVAPVIRAENGYIDKYLGDGIMAVFPGEPASAYRAAVGLIHAVEELNQTRRGRDEEPIQIGIGVHYGKAMLGTIGHQDRMDSTVLSDAVNTASRLESLTKHYGVRLVMSDNFVRALPEDLCSGFLFLDRVRVFGRAEALTLWESLEVLPPEDRTRKAATSLEYRRAWDALHSGENEVATLLLEKLRKDHPLDGPIRQLRLRLQSRLDHKSTVDEGGVEVLAFK